MEAGERYWWHWRASDGLSKQHNWISLAVPPCLQHCFQGCHCKNKRISPLFEIAEGDGSWMPSS